MRNLALLAPLLFATVLAIGADQPKKPAKSSATTTPTPEVEEEEAAEPTPTPEPPRFVASLESSQGEGGERVAVFADGTLVRTTRWRGRSTTKRLNLSREELDVVRRVVQEALAALDEDTPRGENTLTDASARRMKLEIGTAEGNSRTFHFDDATALPLPVGRARGALDDLRSRFEQKTPVGDPVWKATDVATGDRLRRKVDGRWFVVVRDDTFERNLELASEEGDLVLWVSREQVPKHFHDPSLPSPEPAPVERPSESESPR